jgi:DNA-binding XRE family transcriptional regulator
MISYDYLTDTLTVEADGQAIVVNGAGAKGLWPMRVQNQANAIRNMRTDAGLTQKQLAKLLGLSKARISQIEHDERPTLDNIMRIRTAINKFNGARR